MLYSKENQSSWIFFKFGKYSASAKCLLLSPLSLGCGQAVTVPADLNTDGLYGVSVVFQLERWHLTLSAHYCLLTSTVNNGCRMCVCACVCVCLCVRVTICIVQLKDTTERERQVLNSLCQSKWSSGGLGFLLLSPSAVCEMGLL